MKKDWHTADIIAAIRKKNKTLASLSREHGLSASTLANALTRPWPKGELLIAQEIDVTLLKYGPVGILTKISSRSNEPPEMIYQTILMSHKLFLYPKK